jgi:phosphatidylserine decarboxylase
MISTFWVTLLLLFILLVLLYFFGFLRNPKREWIKDPSLILSPANGVVSKILYRSWTSAEIEKDHYPVFATQTEAIWSSWYLINISMNLQNIHYQRAPLASTLIHQEYIEWNFFNAVRDTDSLNAHFVNERNEMTLQTADGFTYKVVQIAWLLARRIESFVTTGQ